MTQEINFSGVDLEVIFNYQPAEPMVMYYPDGSGYPGCAEDIDIITVNVGGVDIVDMLAEGQLKEIEEKISEALQENQYD